jgi:hypothetical protein
MARASHAFRSKRGKYVCSAGLERRCREAVVALHTRYAAQIDRGLQTVPRQSMAHLPSSRPTYLDIQFSYQRKVSSGLYRLHSVPALVTEAGYVAAEIRARDLLLAKYIQVVGNRRSPGHQGFLAPVSVGLRCGQEWWSGFRLGRKNTVKPGLTLVSSSRSQFGMPDAQVLCPDELVSPRIRNVDDPDNDPD